MDSATTSSCSGLEYVTSKSVDPEHILLNLRILAFIEACRTVPLPYPPTQSPVLPSPTSVSTSKKRSSGCLDEEDPECQEQQTALLKSAQKLYALANVITDATHKATYLKELANVGGLLAYKVPEESPVSKYLSQERREAVAEQVNSAILRRSHCSQHPKLIHVPQTVLAFPLCLMLSFTPDIQRRCGLSYTNST